jgi:TatD DNase family protein
MVHPENLRVTKFALSLPTGSVTIARLNNPIDGKQIFTVATAMDLPSYLELQKIGERSKLVLPTFGIHPRRAAEYADRLPEISRHSESSPAIGEIGLDFHWVNDTSTYPAQRKVLEYFIAAAREQKKFVNLHTKGGEK